MTTPFGAPPFRQILHQALSMVRARLFPRPPRLPNWSRLLSRDADAWAKARHTASGPRILIPSLIGGHGLVNSLETMLAIALTIRGARVETLLCDGLPACMLLEMRDISDPKAIVERRIGESACRACTRSGQNLHQPLGLPLHRLSAWVSDDDRRLARAEAAAVPEDKIATHAPRGLPLGEHAMAGALRYFAKGMLEDEPAGWAVVRRYLEAALLCQRATERLLAQGCYDAAAFNHGIYVPQGIVGAVCRQHGVRVANWVASYRRNTVVFSHGDTYHHTMITEPVDEWANLALSTRGEAEILGYLESRRRGDRDWIWFHEKVDEDFPSYARRHGLDPAKPTIGILTSVFWDAQLHYRTNIFPDMRAWLLETLHYLAQRPDLQVVVRIHPAEIRGTVPSRQPMAAEITKALPNLPPHIHVIPPESPVSTYAVIDACQTAIIYNTKMGVELPALGTPVIVAGEAWVRNKGICNAPPTRESYFDLLDTLPWNGQMDSTTLQRARRYAYHFFFRRMVPLPFLDQTGGDVTIAIERLADLAPGRWPGLDVICEGITSGTPFVYPAEVLGIHN